MMTSAVCASEFLFNLFNCSSFLTRGLAAISFYPRHHEDPGNLLLEARAGPVAALLGGLACVGWGPWVFGRAAGSAPGAAATAGVGSAGGAGAFWGKGAFRRSAGGRGVGRSARFQVTLLLAKGVTGSPAFWSFSTSRDC